MDEEYKQRRRRREELVAQYGYEEGSTMAFEEDVDYIINRLNAYERYAELMERWSCSVKKKYLLIDRRRSVPELHTAEANDVEHRQEEKDPQADAQHE
jgi:hypothetical protein